MDGGARPLSSTSKEEEEEASSSSILRSSWWPRSSSTAAVAYLRCWFSWLRSSSRCVPFGFWQARDARHHSRYGPEGLLPVRRPPFRAANADPHGPGLFSRPQSFSSCCTFLAGYAGYDAPRAVFSTLCRKPMMLGIMAVMDQKNTFSRLWSRQCKLSGSAAVPQLQFFEDRHHPCRGALASHSPDCSLDHRDSPVAREQGDRCPCYAVRASSTDRLHPCRDVEADPHGLADHGDSALASGQGGRCPVAQVVRVSQVPSWRRPLCSHSCTC